MTPRLEKACEVLKWAIENKKSILIACRNFGVGEGYLREVKKDCSKREGYDTFLKLYNQHKVTMVGEDINKSADDTINLKPEEKRFTQTENSATIDYKGNKMLKSLKDAVKFFEIDTNLWEIERWVCNSYPVSAREREQDLKWTKNKEGQQIMEGYSKRFNKWTSTVNYQVKVWLKKRVEVEDAFVFEDFYKDLLHKHNPFKYKTISYNKLKEHNLLEINLFDLHLGKLCWSEEVNNNYDTKIASTRFNYVLSELVQRAKSTPFERILFPVGNDFFNSDTMVNTTTMGTRVDEDSRWQKTFKTGVNLQVGGIDYLSQFAPVDILIIPGNHDWTKSFFLGETLKAWYRNNKNVTVDNSANPRKYYEYGNILLGFTHGNNEKHNALRSLMAGEAAQAWARTRYREWHIGHQHRKISEKHSVQSEIMHEELFTVVRAMSSLSGTDTWHHQKGYLGPTRAGGALQWNKEQGLTGELNVNIKLNDDL